MEIIISLGINLFTTLIKKYIKPKFGDLGVQAIVLVLAVIAAAILYLYNQNEGLQIFVKQAGIIFASAIAIYSVLLSKIGIFK